MMGDRLSAERGTAIKGDGNVIGYTAEQHEAALRERLAEVRADLERKAIYSDNMS